MSTPLPTPQGADAREADPAGAAPPGPGGRRDDPLLGSLVILTRLHHRPRSPEALAAGLPLEHGRLTPELMVRAAARAGLTAGIVRRKLSDLTPSMLPAVLLLAGGRACVLVAIGDDERLTVLDPESGGGENRITRAELLAEYSGRAILAKPAYRFDQPPADTDAHPSGHWFWSTIRANWPLYGEVAVASVLINLFGLAAPLFVMNVYDRVIPNYAVETLWVLASGVAVVFVFDLLMRALRGYFLDIAGKKADVLLSSRIFQHVMGVRMAARPASVGAFANNLQEFESFRDFFTSATLSTLIDLPFVLLFLGVIAAIGGWELAAIPALVLPVVLLAGVLLQLPLRRVVGEMFREGAARHAALVETLIGLESVKTLRAEGTVQRRWERQVGVISRLGLKARFLSATGVNLAQFLQQLAYVGVIVQGVYLIMDGTLTMGGLIAAAILTGRALAPMAQVAGLLTRYHQSMAAYRTLDGIMALPEERPAERRFVHRDALQGALELRDVKFAYPGQPVAALDGVSIAIASGERVALVGPVGSGKSTIQRLLLGLYEPDAGAVLMDGTDLRQLDPAEVRRHIGYVPQDIVLFSGTVRDNIAYGAPYLEDEAILRAAHLAGFADTLSRHPQGFDLQVGERGTALSGGQRQAVAIARAVLLDPPVLILDEPTNAMDSVTEQRVLGNLRRWAVQGGKTLVIITHKTSLLPVVERLVVVDQGKVVADGARDEVLRALSANRRSAAAAPAAER